jgi:hypothetical protein
MKNGFSKTWNGVGYRRRQRGASLLEGIAYLGIAAIVILGAVSLLTSAFGNAQSNRAMEEIVSIRTAARKLYSGQAIPAAVLDANLVAARALPTTLTVGAGNAITSPWGAVTVTGLAGNTFSISYAGVPQAECVNILSGASGWISVTGSGAAQNNLAGATVTTAQATTTCVAGANLVVLTAQG